MPSADQKQWTTPTDWQNEVVQLMDRMAYALERIAGIGSTLGAPNETAGEVPPSPAESPDAQPPSS